MHMAPFLDAEQIAAQFGTPGARDRMLEGLKRPEFAELGRGRAGSLKFAPTPLKLATNATVN
jgi:hypothetical protein